MKDITTGASATAAGIRDAVKDVTHLHRLRGRSVVQGMTADEWERRANDASAGIAADWREPYVLAYVTAAKYVAEGLSELN